MGVDPPLKGRHILRDDARKGDNESLNPLTLKRDVSLSLGDDPHHIAIKPESTHKR